MLAVCECVCVREMESQGGDFFPPLLTSYLKAKFESGLSGDLISFMAGRLSLSPCHGPLLFLFFFLTVSQNKDTMGI